MAASPGTNAGIPQNQEAESRASASTPSAEDKAEKAEKAGHVEIMLLQQRKQSVRKVSLYHWRARNMAAGRPAGSGQRQKNHFPCSGTLYAAARQVANTRVSVGVSEEDMLLDPLGFAKRAIEYLGLPEILVPGVEVDLVPWAQRSGNPFSFDILNGWDKQPVRAHEMPLGDLLFEVHVKGVAEVLRHVEVFMNEQLKQQEAAVCLFRERARRVAAEQRAEPLPQGTMSMGIPLSKKHLSGRDFKVSSWGREPDIESNAFKEAKKDLICRCLNLRLGLDTVTTNLMAIAATVMKNSKLEEYLVPEDEVEGDDDASNDGNVSDDSNRPEVSVASTAAVAAAPVSFARWMQPPGAASPQSEQPLYTASRYAAMQSRSTGGGSSVQAPVRTRVAENEGRQDSDLKRPRVL